MKDHGVKLGFMSIFARASVMALKEVPAANSMIDGDQQVFKEYVDLSVAVATPKGLVTPVVRNAETMGLIDIEKAIAELGKKVSQMLKPS
jgi:2-oxoglutarate dehydrogenase E2 component (dihydrolipoamide succinyltransferase)